MTVQCGMLAAGMPWSGCVASCIMTLSGMSVWRRVAPLRCKDRGRLGDAELLARRLLVDRAEDHVGHADGEVDSDRDYEEQHLGPDEEQRDDQNRKIQRNNTGRSSPKQTWGSYEI